jgi:PAS domain S-box-containing protein
VIFTQLINNLTCLLALGVLYNFVARRFAVSSRRGQVLSGLMFGLAAIVIMLNPMILAPGVRIDARTVIISLAGFFGGVIPVLIAGGISAALRAWLGGAGMVPGILHVVVAVGLGLGYRYLWKSRPGLLSPWYFYLFSLLLQLCCVAFALLLPGDLFMKTLPQFGLAYVGIFPLASLLLGMVLAQVHRDIATEEALSESERRYRAAFDQSAVGMCQVSPQRVITRANQGLCNLLGYQPAELQKMSLLDIAVVKNDQERDAKHQQLISGKRKTYSREEGLLHKNGQLIWVNLTVSAIYEDEGELSYLMAVVQDITPRIEAQAALAESERHLRALIVSAKGFAVFRRIVNPDSLHDTKVIYISPSAQDILGIDDIYDFQEWLKVLHPDDAKLMWNPRHNGPYEREYAPVLRIYHGKTKKLRWLQIIGTVELDPDGRPVYLNGILHDITEQKKVAKALQASEERLRLTLEATRDGIWEYRFDQRQGFFQNASSPCWDMRCPKAISPTRCCGP